MLKVDWPVPLVGRLEAGSGCTDMVERNPEPQGAGGMADCEPELADLGPAVAAAQRIMESHLASDIPVAGAP